MISTCVLLLALLPADPPRPLEEFWSHAAALDWGHDGGQALPAHKHDAPPSAYAAAYAESLRTGKPLIVWCGGNFCSRCVEDSRGEFLHAFVDSWHGQRGPATVLLVPGEDGHMYRAATVTRWTVGSRDWGHIPSARRLLADWRARAKQGNKAPLTLLNFGDGGNWGMANDVYWRNYGGGYSSGSAPMRSGRLFRGTGGGC